MTSLVPCHACNRHVRVGEACPFCGAFAAAARTSRLARTSRAALVALAAAGCDHRGQITMYGGPPVQADAGVATLDASPVPTTVYGGPPPVVSVPIPVPNKP
jgi:hypothetical protein